MLDPTDRECPVDVVPRTLIRQPVNVASTRLSSRLEASRESRRSALHALPVWPRVGRQLVDHDPRTVCVERFWLGILGPFR
jgi:hypothetical protein